MYSLQRIQELAINEKSDLNSVLLSLRLFLEDNDILEDWVKYELEGYPEEIEVPFYRVVNISHIGIFTERGDNEPKRATISSDVIKKYTGEDWSKHKVRDSIIDIEEIVKGIKDGSQYGLNASNLLLKLPKGIYGNYSCREIYSLILPTNFYGIQQTVRNKILKLVMELEKSVPGAINVDPGSSATGKKETGKVQKIFQQIIYGDVRNAVAGSGHVSVAITERDSESFVKYLVESGILKSDASELAKIMETENPESADEPFGEKAQEWIANNIKKAMNGTWEISISAVSQVLAAAAIKFYGL